MSTALTEVPGWYIEFQAALLRQAPRPGEIDQTTAEGWTSNQKGLKKNLAGCLLPDTASAPVEPAKLELLLEPVGTVTTSATTTAFVAKEKLVLDTSNKAKVKISYLGDNLKACFLSGKGKTEDPISEQTLRYGKLRKASVDMPIVNELGGEAKAETTFSEIYDLMVKQPKGEKGALLNNGWANIFYVRDQNGVLRAVVMYWRDDGWHLHAYPFECPGRWCGGGQVFSRNSVLKPSEPVAAAS